MLATCSWPSLHCISVVQRFMLEFYTVLCFPSTYTKYSILQSAKWYSQPCADIHNRIMIFTSTDRLMNINNDRAPLRWRVTVRLINIHKNVFMHCAKYEHARALWRPSMKTLNTVLSLLSYIQRWVLRNSATAGTIGEIVNCKTARHFSRAL